MNVDEGGVGAGGEFKGEEGVKLGRLKARDSVRLRNLKGGGGVVCGV